MSCKIHYKLLIILPMKDRDRKGQNTSLPPSFNTSPSVKGVPKMYVQGIVGWHSALQIRKLRHRNKEEKWLS